MYYIAILLLVITGLFLALKRRLYIIISTIWLIFVLFIVGFYHTSIFDPLEFLFVVSYFAIGPILLIIAIVRVLKAVLFRKLKVALLLYYLFNIIVILTILFNWWNVLTILPTKMFLSLSEENEKIASEAMKNYLEGETFQIQGFRYPYCHIKTALGYHKKGILYVMLPSRPGSKDWIVYNPDDKGLNSNLVHLGGPWYIKHAKY